jgi:hemerythrin superfamily protein
MGKDELELEIIINYIVDHGITTIKNNFNSEKAVIDYVAIFSKNKNEFKKLLSIIKTIGKEVDKKNTKTGKTFLLNKPLKTKA